MTDPTGDRAALSRRAVTAAGVLGVALTAACSPADRPSGAASGGASPGSSAGSSSAPAGSPAGTDLDPDEQLLLNALAGESRMRERLDQARHRHRSLQRALAATLEAHRRHVDLLASAVGNVPNAGHGTEHDRGPAASATAEVSALARAERTLSRQHGRLALDAASGQVARLLGSLSAAAAQQGQILSTTVPKEQDA